jgi:hypothetical protein
MEEQKMIWRRKHGNAQLTLYNGTEVGKVGTTFEAHESDIPPAFRFLVEPVSPAPIQVDEPVVGTTVNPIVDEPTPAPEEDGNEGGNTPVEPPANTEEDEPRYQIRTDEQRAGFFNVVDMDTGGFVNEKLMRRKTAEALIAQLNSQS